MHTDRIENPFLAIDACIEGVVLLQLLSESGAPASRAELARRISGSRGAPVDIDPAIDGLYAAGLVHVAGELVSASLAARRVDELYPLCI
jgi:hypothetical protein